jgi:hypothetical protein
MILKILIYIYKTNTSTIHQTTTQLYNTSYKHFMNFNTIHNQVFFKHAFVI